MYKLPLNSMRQIFTYFQNNTSKPLMGPEFSIFWHSLTVEELEYYRYVDLETSLEPLERKYPD